MEQKFIPPPKEKKEAIALRYNKDEDKAPKILAKGKGDIAQKIKEIATINNIPLHEDSDLVTLLSVLEIDADIPPRLYKALAEVLAHLYRANSKIK